MGTSGLVGQFSAYGVMVSEGMKPLVAVGEIALMHFVLPALLTWIICTGMRKPAGLRTGI